MHLKFASGARVAVVNAPALIIAQTSGASSAGFAYRQFDDRAQAIEWLQMP